MKNHRKLRAVVIGCGSIGSLHARAVRESAHATLVATCDSRLGRAKALARETRAGESIGTWSDFDKMLRAERPDVAFVATPDHLHVQPVLAALRHGCHVFCEKPLALTVAEARAMVRAAALHKRYLAVDYNRRYGFGYGRARLLMDEGRLGQIRHAVVHVIDGPPARFTTPPHALLKILLSHHVDLLLWFCGDVRSVYATANGTADGRITDTCVTLDFASGAVGALVGGLRTAPQRTVEQMDLVGTRGVCRVDDVMGRVTFWRHDPDEAIVSRPNYFRSGNRFYDSVADHVADFLARLFAGKSPAVTGADGLRGLGIIQAAIRSIHSGKRIPFRTPERN